MNRIARAHLCRQIAASLGETVALGMRLGWEHADVKVYVYAVAAFHYARLALMLDGPREYQW